MNILSAAHVLGGGVCVAKKASPLEHLSFYNDETWHNYTLPEEDPKNI